MLTLLLLIIASDDAARPPFNRCQPRYAVISAQLAAVDKQIVMKRFSSAKKKLDITLDKLGYVAVNRSIADDTGMHLLHADSLARRGNIQAAVEIKRRILATRLRWCMQPLVD